MSAGVVDCALRQRVLDRAVDAARDRRAHAGADTGRVDVAGVADEVVTERAAGAPGMSTPNSVTS